jgi:prepilin-type N-terminal cleavage/methylation domain-containing protein
MNLRLERPNPFARLHFIKNPEAGFTLLELAIVVACVTILAAATGPSFLNYLEDAGLKQAVHQLSGDLHRAKSRAIRMRANQRVTFTRATNEFTCPNPNRTINLADFWGNPTFVNNPDGGSPDTFSNDIEFNPRGLLTPMATEQAYLAGNGRTFRVQVSAAGAVSIHEWRGGNWIQ